MATKKKRLFKVAAEINIGRNAIVEFLQSKGFDITNKATATLSPEMLEAIDDKFKRERKAAEIQRDKLEKHRKIRKEALQKEIEEKGEPEKEEAEAEKAGEEEQKAKETKKEQKEPEAKEEEEKAEKKPKTKKKKAAEKKEEPEKKERKAKPRKKKTEEAAKEEAKKKKTKKAKEEEKAKELETAEKAEAKKEEADKEKEAKEIEKVKKEEAEKAKEQAAKEKEKKAEKEEAEKEKVAAKRKPKKKQRKTIAEVDIEESEISPKKGLKIVGKIDLDKEKRREKEIKEAEKKREKEARKKPPKEPEKDKKKKETKEPGKDLSVKERKKMRSRKKKKERRKKKLSVRELVKEEDVDKALKKTLSNMSGSKALNQRQKLRQKKKAEREEKELKKKEEEQQESKTLRITEFVTTADLADLMDINPNDIIVKCMELGLMVTLNQRLDKDTITLIADDYGYDVEFMDEKTAQLAIVDDEEDDEENLEFRSPIVTVMGHVDHGKTSLLDYVRKTRVVAGEAGGITQHIGAYRVELPEDKFITFLDTPGHEAFTAMRARGAQITDIVVLVAAADDSVMPQTLEAISHARAANVPIIVAINKTDKPEANPERIRQQLSEQNILVEDWGGKVQSVEISAKTGKNVDNLLDRILLEAEMLDLKANPNKMARGAVIEANMDRGLGPVSTIIIQQGTLKLGQPFVAGVNAGRVRAMFDERGNKIKSAEPTIPVRVIGFDGLPEAGDILITMDTDSKARTIANERKQLKREQEIRQTRHMTLDDISQQIQMGGVKELYLVIKGDVAGSIEALSDALQKQSTDEVKVVVLHKGVGAISESDVMLAMASKAVIIGFQVSVSPQARKLANQEAIDIRQYSIIYDAINDIRLAIEGLLSPEIHEDRMASIEVRKVFKISKLGNVAGCYVTDGKVHRNDRVKVLRDGLPIFKGKIQSLKREKEDVKEVDSGYECGILLDGFTEIQEGDVIEAFRLKEIKRTLT